MSEIKTVYFAGKVSKGGGYRGKLLHEPRVMSYGYRTYEVNGGKLIYGGPFAISCDHGCFHGPGTHGILEHEVESGAVDDFPELEDPHGGSAYGTTGAFPQLAVQKCLDQILQADAVHCFLDSIDAYGTLFELGFAAAFMKPVYLYYLEGKHNWKKHYWFSMNSLNLKCCEPGTETSIHPDVLTPQKTYKERYYEYLKSPEWNKKRKAKIKEAGGRCQLCNTKGKLSVHHRTYDRVYNEILTDLIALCDNCHKKFHDIDTQQKAQ